MEIGDMFHFSHHAHKIEPKQGQIWKKYGSLFFRVVARAFWVQVVTWRSGASVSTLSKSEGLVATFREREGLWNRLGIPPKKKHLLFVFGFCAGRPHPAPPCVAILRLTIFWQWRARTQKQGLCVRCVCVLTSLPEDSEKEYTFQLFFRN